MSSLGAKVRMFCRSNLLVRNGLGVHGLPRLAEGMSAVASSALASDLASLVPILTVVALCLLF